MVFDKKQYLQELKESEFCMIGVTCSDGSPVIVGILKKEAKELIPQLEAGILEYRYTKHSTWSFMVIIP